MSKIENYPVLVYTPDKTFTVRGEFNSKTKPDSTNDFKEDKGYLDTSDNHAWIYVDKKPRDPNQYPYFWIENGKYVKSDPSNEIYRLFKLNKFVNINTDHIIDITDKTKDDGPIFRDEVINDLNSSSEIFRPVILTTDDFLKKIIKTVINAMEVNLSKHKYKMMQKYMISNMKSALNQGTKMSTTYFNAWAEILGLKVTIVIETTDASEDKLDEPYVYLSERDSVFTLSELAETGFTFPEIKKDDTEE